jgi:alpha-glucosidase
MEPKGSATVALVVLCVGLSTFGRAATTAERLAVSSPDGNLTITLSLKAKLQPYLPGQRAYYRVSYKGAPILTDSPLGLDFRGAPPLERDFEIVGTDRQAHAATWENPFGAKRTVPDYYNQLTVSLRERRPPARRVDVTFRAYNEGIAFRYFLPRQPGLEQFSLVAENTGFYFAQDVSAYAMNLGSYFSSYEEEYRRMSLREIKPTSILGLPILVEVPKGPWVALLEADLTDYAGMYVGGVPSVPNALVSKLAAPPPLQATSMALYTGGIRQLDDFWSLLDMSGKLLRMPGSLRQGIDPEELVVAKTPKATPWRVLMVSPQPGGLIENNYLILNLSEPCALKDTTWIKPGKAAWDWWSGSFARNVNFTPGMNTATMKHYIDFAADYHLEYMLVDAGWSTWLDITKPVPEVNIQDIIDYARQRGVKVLLWMPWTAVALQGDVAFPLYEKWGVAGVKIDFMQRDDQEMVNFYEQTVRKAAEHHLVVDFHGAFKPTGLRRTYPNLLTREGVRGLENSKWSALITPEHDVTLAFTRMLAGPLDFTPGGFRNAARGQFKAQYVEPMTQGTRAHQLAMYVVYESPLAMLVDYPEAYRNQPGIEFLEKVPTVWDDTKVLNGEVGKYITIARRHGTAWYLGAMTNWDARDFELPLSFLGSGEYGAQIFADGADADRVGTSLSITNKQVRGGDKLPLHLAPGGGVAIIFTPRN